MTLQPKSLLAGFAICLLTALPLRADPPEITNVVAQDTGNGWRFDVSITHPDTGWDHYADGWEVLTPDGKSLGMRELAHPHVNEQPFTRSLSGVEIPAGLSKVLLRARCNVTGWSDTRVPVTLPGR